VGFFLIALRNRKQAGRFTLILIAVAACSLPLADVIKEAIQTRLQSFSDIQGDTSYQDRQYGYSHFAAIALSEPFGAGLGGLDPIAEQRDIGFGARDSGLLEILYSLGWFGGAIYLFALGLIVANLFGTGQRHPNFSFVATSIGVAIAAELLLGSIMRDLSGVVLWSFAGIGIGLHTLNTGRGPVLRERQFGK